MERAIDDTEALRRNTQQQWIPELSARGQLASGGSGRPRTARHYHGLKGSDRQVEGGPVWPHHPE